MNLVKEYHHQNQGDYDENANRYYNDRDFRREQLLEERMKKQKIKTLVNRYYCNSSFNYWHFCDKSYIDHKRNRTINNIRIMQQMMYLKLSTRVQNQSDNIKKQVEDAKMILKIK